MGQLTKLLEGIVPPSEAKREYIGASSIGNPCWRRIWFDYHGYERADLPTRTRRIFDVGNRLEGYIVSLLELVTKVDVDNDEIIHPEYPWFKGNIDGYLPKFGALLEIKTANHASFQQFVNHGLRKWNEQYYAQIQAYMGLSGIYKAFLLVFNKNTAQFHDEIVTFDPDFYEKLVEKAKLIHDSDTMPPRISSNPLFYLCKMCPFIGVCHQKDKDVSGGY